MLFSFFSFSQSSTYSTTLDLDGSSSFIEIPSSNDLKFDSDKFTLEAWIKIENLPESVLFSTYTGQIEIIFFLEKGMIGAFI
jgi:hypothetical protein